MSAISKQLNQLSGFLELIAVPLSNIVSIESNVLYCHNLESNHVPDCTRETIALSIEATKSAPGNLFDIQVSGFLRGSSEGNGQLLESMLQHRFIVVLRNQEGSYIRVGSETKGLLFTWQFAPAPQAEGSIGYQLNFKGSNLVAHKPVNYPFSIK